MSTGTEIIHHGSVPDTVWRRILAQPGRAPELIALAAADRFAGPAERWTGQAGPDHDPASLAETAFKKHVRLARLEGGALGVGGIVTAAPNLAGLAWIQARMVFFIAASHGYDPRHPMRPAELLSLWGLYETPVAARESLDGIGVTMAESFVTGKLSKTRERALSEVLVRYVGKRFARRVAGRLVPFLGIPVSAIQNGGATKDLGRRALAYYGGASPGA